ncbi:MAG: type II toxin-antitoxin system VapC family toxin [bacterium]|nr:type II toxin-antitoxin system VapC family toxin [bacterium]
MKYLLDTHTFLWILFDDNNLSEKVKVIIRDLENEIYVSVISYWEISLKFAVGKLELEGITPDELLIQAEQIGIQTLEISKEDASTFYNLPKMKHKDPFDRLIIWQAINRNIILISKDKEMKDYQKFGLKSLWK